MQAEPFSGVAMPLEVEAVAADPVETGEGRVKLFAEILRETGAVALNEAILGAVPLAEDIDGIVELRRPDGGQEAGLQEVVDEHKHVGEPGLRIDVVELGGHDQGRHDRGTLGTAI